MRRSHCLKYKTDRTKLLIHKSIANVYLSVIAPGKGHLQSALPVDALADQ